MIRLNVKTRLGLLVVMSMGVAGAMGVFAYSGMSMVQTGLNTVLRAGQGGTRFMEADMMHDAIRADVLAAAQADTDEQRAEVAKDFEAHAQTFESVRQDLDKMAFTDAKLVAALQQIGPALQAYVDQGRSIIAVANDHDAWKKAWPAFCESFEKLEEANSKVSEEFDRVGMEAKVASDASLRRARVDMAMALGVGLTLVGVGAWFNARGIIRPMQKCAAVFETVAKGDLTIQFDESMQDGLGDLGRSANKMIASMREAVSQVSAASEQVSAAATEIAASSEQISGGMTEQSRQVEQVAAAIEQMAHSVEEVANKASEAAQNAAQAGASADEGGKVVSQTVREMEQIEQVVGNASSTVTQLGKRSEQIGAVIEVINDIADQTNLLALNAAIEAARAGEHGRGFAVVADEVRKLAERTAVATEEVAKSIHTIRSETDAAVKQIGEGVAIVRKGVERASESGASMRKIVDDSGKITCLIQSIAAAGEEQSSAAEQITKSVTSVRSVSRETAEGVAQAATAAADLSRRSEELRTLVQRFKV